MKTEKSHNVSLRPVGIIRKFKANRVTVFNPISTKESVENPSICFLPVTSLFLSQFPQNLVTFPRIEYRIR